MQRCFLQRPSFLRVSGCGPSIRRARPAGGGGEALGELRPFIAAGEVDLGLFEAGRLGEVEALDPRQEQEGAVEGERAFQARAGGPPPVTPRPMFLPSGPAIHTTVVKPPVKPSNQAS